MIGRRAKPGTDMLRIREAVEFWRPLFQQLDGIALDTMKDAIAEAFSMILYIPVDLSSRQWDTYCDVRTAQELAETVRALLDFDDAYRGRTDDLYAQWIHSLFTEDCIFLVDEMVGINKPIPVGAPPMIAKAYEEALTEVCRMAELIPDDGDSAQAVKQNAAEKLKRFREKNPF